MNQIGDVRFADAVNEERREMKEREVGVNVRSQCGQGLERVDVGLVGGLAAWVTVRILSRDPKG